MPDRVHIYWDNSNIFIGSKSAAIKRDKGFADQGIRIQFDNLLTLARGGRSLASALCVGSVPPDLAAVWDKLKASGVDIELYERGAESGREQGIDQCLQVHMLRALFDQKPPEVAVLLTGDGAGYESGAGFYADLERMAKGGWGVEVISWETCCKRVFKEWANRVGVFIPLEDYFESVTFVQGGRRSAPVSLTHRPKATPRSPA